MSNFLRALLSVLLVVIVSAVVRTGIDLLRIEQQPRNPIGIPSPPVEASVYLAPIGAYSPAEADLLVAHYREKFGLAITILPPIRVPAEAFDRAREQVIGEGLIDAISRTAPAASDPSAVVIGLTNADMYIAARTWRYAYSVRAQDRFAVVSTARMGDGLFVDEARRIRRIQKMVTKNLGVLYYRLPQSDDPGSVLYRNILGPQDLDGASEDF
jgi:hypothetical protein